MHKDVQVGIFFFVLLVLLPPLYMIVHDRKDSVPHSAPEAGIYVNANILCKQNFGVHGHHRSKDQLTGIT